MEQLVVWSSRDERKKHEPSVGDSEELSEFGLKKVLVDAVFRDCVGGHHNGEHPIRGRTTIRKSYARCVAFRKGLVNLIDAVSDDIPPLEFCKRRAFEARGKPLSISGELVGGRNVDALEVV